MFEFLRSRLRQGTPTVRLPDAGRALPERFRGLPVLQPVRSAMTMTATPDSQRSGASSELGEAAADVHPAFDVGACLFSPEEAEDCRGMRVRFTHDHRMASGTRDGLVSETGEIQLARALDRTARRLFGRSLRLRSVVTGSCGGCEAELVALGNVVFDLARFGVQFVASPRHADGIVITGALNRNMQTALAETYRATPLPRIVIAVGACAISGGPFRGSSEVRGEVPAEIPVDLYVPGCPPHPLTIMDGLLRILGRLETGASHEDRATQRR
jgi:Ni,Fe-hydrogenase III small subunit